MGRSVERSKIQRGESKKQKKDLKNFKKTQPFKIKKRPTHVLDAACTRFNFVARDVFERTFAKDVVTVTNESTAAGELPSILLLAHFGDLIAKLNVNYINHRIFNYELEGAISEYCRKSLIEVQFKDGRDFAFNRIERPFKLVNKVLFTRCQMVKLASEFNKLFPNVRRLDSIDAPKFIYCVQQNFPQLDHLGIVNPFFYCDAIYAKNAIHNVVMATINLNPQLKSLKLMLNGMPLTSDDLSNINVKLPLLETLDIVIGNGNPEKQIHFQNLRKLHLFMDQTTSALSNFAITTRLPVRLKVVDQVGWLYSDWGGFLSTNQNTMDRGLYSQLYSKSRILLSSK